MKQTLYLGLEVPPHLQTKNIVHCPIIKIVPKSHTDLSIQSAFENFSSYTHLIFTSRSAVAIFFDLTRTFGITKVEVSKKIIISVGQRTAAKLKEHETLASLIAKEETAEGITQSLNSNELKNAHFFLPQSSLARTVIRDWLKDHGICHTSCPIYDTIPNIPSTLPNLIQFDHIIFTSPSTIDAFLLAYGSLPQGKILSCIGPITERYLLSKSP